MVRELRSKADLRTITYNIVRLRQYMREVGRGPSILVNCVLTRKNIGHIAKLADFCRELRIDQLLLGEVMLLVDGNPKMPETLADLDGDDVLTLVRQIVAAERVLEGSATALIMQDHLAARLGDLLDSFRQGETIQKDASAYFHRRLESAACRQPWAQPFVRADGKVYPCCTGYRHPVGDLRSESLEQITEGAAMRAIRASIMEGRPTIGCDGCTLARGESFDEFAREVHAWVSRPK